MNYDPNLFYCICCEEWHMLNEKQESGFCSQCHASSKSWEIIFDPPWSLILFLGVLAALVEMYNLGGFGATG